MAKALTAERVPRGQLLTDITPISLQLVESASGGKLLVRGEFARSGQATENRRVYPRSLWEREIKKLRTALQERKLLGELDHPDSGRTKLTRASHVITDLSMSDDGTVVGESEILDTGPGRDLQALLRAGCRVGVSSRGYGSTRTNEEGHEVVQEDYTLVTFDFVADPADSNAYPEVFREASEESKSMAAKKKVEQVPVALEVPTPVSPITGIATPDTEETDEPADSDEDKPATKPQDSPEPKPEAVEEPAPVESPGDESKGDEPEEDESEDDVPKDQAPQDEAALMRRFEGEVLSHLGKLSSEARDRIRTELLADPNVARAREAVEAIKRVLRPFVLPEDAEVVVKQRDESIAKLQREVKERDLKLKEAQGQVDQLAKLSRTVGCRYYMEKALQGNPDAAEARKMVGEVDRYATVEAFKAGLGSALSVLKTRRDEEKRRQEELGRVAKQAREEVEAELQRSRSVESSMREDVDKLTRALERALEANKQMGLQLYAQQKLATHPQRKDLLKQVESLGLESQEEVDRLIEDAREPVRTSEELDATRARVRKLTGGGRGVTPLEEEKGAAGAARRTRVQEEDFAGTGVSLDQIRQLSGLRRS